jgi:hypothetical protein
VHDLVGVHAGAGKVADAAYEPEKLS